MAARKRPTAKSARGNLGSQDPADLSPAMRVAHEIVTGRADLEPSIERIMQAGLDEPGVERALTLFRDSLSSPGDPNRDPRVAIAAAAV